MRNVSFGWIPLTLALWFHNWSPCWNCPNVHVFHVLCWFIFHYTFPLCDNPCPFQILLPTRLVSASCICHFMSDPSGSHGTWHGSKVGHSRRRAPWVMERNKRSTNISLGSFYSRMPMDTPLFFSSSIAPPCPHMHPPFTVGGSGQEVPRAAPCCEFAAPTCPQLGVQHRAACMLSLGIRSGDSASLQGMQQLQASILYISC